MSDHGGSSSNHSESDFRRRAADSGDNKPHAFDADEFLAHGRKKTVQNLKALLPDDGIVESDDLHYILQSVHALITTNEEIWQRCRPNLFEGTGIRRYEELRCSHVVAKKVSCFHRRGEIRVVFQPEVESRVFGSLPAMPLTLQRIIYFDNDCFFAEGPTFPDYRQYFEQAMVLEDDVLSPFLVLLKKHLESIHIFLGNIESWLVDGHRNVEFLEELFDKKIDLPALRDLEAVEDTDTSDLISLEIPEEPEGRLSPPKDEPDEGMMSFRKGEPRTLLRLPSRDIHKLHFLLNSDAEKQKLRKFVEFLLLEYE